MSNAAPLPFRKVRDVVDPAEWQMRVDLAAFYRLVAHYGFTDLAHNHITVRVPGTTDQFLINAYGMFYEEITASSLYKIDVEGNVILQPDTPYPVNYAGFIIHSAVHRARHDIMCVAHTHTRANMAVAAMKCGLLPISQMALRFHGNMSYHDYEGSSRKPGQRERLANDLAGFDNMIMRNHGVLCCGRTIPQAFNYLYQLEVSCQTQVDLMASGAEIVMPSQEAIDSIVRTYEEQRTGPIEKMAGTREWPGLLRMLDRRDSSYRD